EFIATKFPDRIISHNSAVNWPPRLCDLTPLDYFSWGYVKDQVYANNPQSIEVLKTNIRRVIGEIKPQLWKNVIENFDKRIDVYKRGPGGHLSDTLFDS
ncbi:hypothetical protein WN55_04308, partial [Dufourea novaeangliae]